MTAAQISRRGTGRHHGGSVSRFEEVLEEHDIRLPVRGEVRTLQLNLGRRCNMSCTHCHVGAGPGRKETMSPEVAERVLQLLAACPTAETLDITGGAPELNPSFRAMVREARRLDREVIDRCNLTILMEPGMEDLAGFLAESQVHVVASLPCYLSENVDAQRGMGTYERSIEAMKRLNARGYAQPGTGLKLDLVYNPMGAFLPPPQERLEADYKRELHQRCGVRFDSLLTITNMPIHRFAADLRRQGKYDAYCQLLIDSFNHGTMPGIMCRSQVSVDWRGRLYDCDFNQALDLPLSSEGLAERTQKGPEAPLTVWDVARLEDLAGGEVVTDDHCFGCTAGAGSSCRGALD